VKGLLLQDFITVRTTLPSVFTTQSEQNWLDLSAYRDVILWLDTREQSGSPQLSYQTAVAKDEALFTTITTVSPSVGITLTPILQDTASIPVARWFRWQLSGSGGDITFRIWVAANKPGRRNLNQR
jgi:hypothetical protein